ncbi:Putative GST-like protein [Podospora comata]|uniref:GST-like protein n=1 Tax=Podospora comata TaxID=48703 RepID=A0ABY6S3S5_PODCO|nr:Putative GST-like protein [Podospora comata]
MSSYHLHITNKNYSSWSLRPWLLMKELSLPFEEHLHPLAHGSGYRQPQWKSFSPVCHVPCLHYHHPPSGSSDPIILWESLAIVEFLHEQFPNSRIYPDSLPARAWARSAVAEMHAGFGSIRQEMGMNVSIRVELSDEAFNEGLVKDLRRINEVWEEGLAKFGGPFLAGGEFGAVDAFFAPVVLRLGSYLGAGERFLGERAKGYMERINGLEGVREWVAAGVKEKERHEAHEVESLEGPGRKLVRDLREEEQSSGRA